MQFSTRFQTYYQYYTLNYIRYISHVLVTVLHGGIIHKASPSEMSMHLQQRYLPGRYVPICAPWLCFSSRSWPRTTSSLTFRPPILSLHAPVCRVRATFTHAAPWASPLRHGCRRPSRRSRPDPVPTLAEWIYNEIGTQIGEFLPQPQFDRSFFCWELFKSSWSQRINCIDKKVFNGLSARW